jgi:hypothetical protein
MGETKVSFTDEESGEDTMTAYVYFFFNREDENDRIARLITKETQEYPFQNHRFWLNYVPVWKSAVEPLWNIDIDNPTVEYLDYIFKNYGHTYDEKTQKWLTGMPVDPKYLKALNNQRDINIKIGNKKKIVNRIKNEKNNSNVIHVDFKSKTGKS